MREEERCVLARLPFVPDTAGEPQDKKPWPDGVANYVAQSFHKTKETHPSQRANARKDAKDGPPDK